MSKSAPEELVTLDLEHAVVMGEAYKRLQRNGDFKTVITNGFLDEKVKASVSLLAVPQIKDAGQRPNVIEDLIAASNLGYFFQMIEQQYEAATAPILSDEEEEELARLEAEEAAEQLVN